MKLLLWSFLHKYSLLNFLSSDEASAFGEEVMPPFYDANNTRSTADSKRKLENKYVNRLITPFTTYMNDTIRNSENCAMAMLRDNLQVLRLLSPSNQLHLLGT